MASHTRRAPRVPPLSEFFASGLYMLASQAGQDWASCRVVDLSDGGAGLELRGLWPTRNREHMLLRIVSAVTDQPVTYCAAIRHQHVTESGTLRVGVEFVDVPVPEPGRERHWQSQAEFADEHQD